jgi:lysophospholipase L1-like esterase
MKVRMWAPALPVLFLSIGSLDHRQDSSTTPLDRLSEQWWKVRHEQMVRMSQYGRADVAFLGDSITQGWEGAGQEVWLRDIAPLKAANFGFGGDRTEHVLWRLQNGELVGMHPRLVVLMIGTNNIGKGQSPQQTADGVRAVVAALRKDLPESKVLLLGIFPRGPSADYRLRKQVAAATQEFRSCADGRRVIFADIGGVYLREDGELRTSFMPDLLHPNASGYQLWAKAVVPLIRSVLREQSGG